MSESSVTIRANGRSETLASGTTVSRFLADRQVNPRSVAVEVNGTALLRSEYDTQVLQENDRIEVIRVVAGG